MTFQTVKIKGLDFPVSFGHAALYDFEKSTGVKIFELGEKTLSHNQLMELYYYGAKHGHRLAKKEFKIELFDFLDMLTNEVVEMFSNAFAESLPKEDEEKKDTPATEK